MPKVNQQTEKQVLKKVKELISRPEFKEDILKDISRLYKSGGVDPTQFENNFALPKILLCVALEKAAYQHEPFSEDYKKIAKNLRKF